MAEQRIVTVTLNPAVDRVIEAAGFAVGKRVTGRVVAWYPTGKGLTISRVLAAVGARSIATGFVGRQELGMFEEHLERVGEGRIVTQLLVVRARTRDNITVVDPLHDTETHLRAEGFIVQSDDVRRIASKIGLLARAGVVMCFGGSLPKGLTTQDFASMVERSTGQGSRVVIDTGEEPLKAILHLKVWMAKLNVRQVELCAKRPVDSPVALAAAARTLVTSVGGPFEVVIATRGADGAMLFTEREAWLARASVHPGRIVSTVGSGESLLAGVLRVWTRGGSWAEALREGVALATANAVGREAGKLDLADAAEFRELTEVEPIRLD